MTVNLLLLAILAVGANGQQQVRPKGGSDLERLLTKQKVETVGGSDFGDRPVNEAVGPVVQIGESPPTFDPSFVPNQQGNFASNQQGNFAPSNQQGNFGPSQQGGNNPFYPQQYPVGINNHSSQQFVPIQWPGAAEPYQPPTPHVPNNQDTLDYKSIESFLKSPYQELMKSLASTAPIFAPDPNAVGTDGLLSDELEQKLEPPGPPRPPLNVANANYMTAVASIPDRIPAMEPYNPLMGGSNMYQSMSGSQVQGLGSISQGLGLTNQAGGLSNQQGAGWQNPNTQKNPSAPAPAVIKKPIAPVNPSTSFVPAASQQVPQVPIPKPGNPNQWIYTHGGNQFPLLQSPSAGGKNKFPQQITKYNMNYVRPQAPQAQGGNTQRHPPSQQPQMVPQQQTPRLNPFAIQVGDILGFPPGTPFNAVPSNLPTGSRLSQEPPAPAQGPPPDAFKRAYSEVSSPLSLNAKETGFDKPDALSKDGKRTFSPLSNASVVSYSRSLCQVCDEIDKILRQYEVTVYTFELDTMEKGTEMFGLLQQRTGSKEMPQVFVCGRYIGGYSKILDLHKSGALTQMFQRC